jgi:hypothetical protein
MKSLTLPLALFLSVGLFSQDIPNGNFEEWESTPMFTLDPVGWETDNTQLIVSTSQDLDAYEGTYAMRVVPINDGVGEFGHASTTVPIGGIPDGLSFYAKWSQTVTAWIGVDVLFYNNEDQVYSEYWSTSDTASTWTQVVIPFEPIDIATTHVVITVFVAIGDLVPGEGWISVDAMNFGIVSSVNELETTEVTIFPNPADQFLELRMEGDIQIDEVGIIDMNGRTILSAPYDQRIDISAITEGQYLLEFKSAEKVLGRKPFVVQR